MNSLVGLTVTLYNAMDQRAFDFFHLRALDKGNIFNEITMLLLSFALIHLRLGKESFVELECFGKIL